MSRTDSLTGLTPRQRMFTIWTGVGTLVTGTLGLGAREWQKDQAKNELVQTDLSNRVIQLELKRERVSAMESAFLELASDRKDDRTIMESIRADVAYIKGKLDEADRHKGS